MVLDHGSRHFNDRIREHRLGYHGDVSHIVYQLLSGQILAEGQ